MNGNNFVVLYFDGACVGNVAVGHPRFRESRSACAFVVKSASGQVLHREGKYLGPGTSNAAELAGCLLGLTWCRHNGRMRVKVRSDSENAVKWLTGRFRIPRKHPHLAGLLFQISLVLAVESIPAPSPRSAVDRRIRLLSSDPSRVVAQEITHIPRGQNWEADRLAEQALRQ